MTGTLLNTRKGWLILYYEAGKVVELFLHPSFVVTMTNNQAEVIFKKVKSNNITYAIVTEYL